MSQRTSSSLGLLLWILVSTIANSGCAKVPPQAVVLSRTVGQRLVDLQSSHEAFVRAYFQVTRQRLNDFLANQWTPTFLGKFVENSVRIESGQHIQATLLVPAKLDHLTIHIRIAKTREVSLSGQSRPLWQALLIPTRFLPRGSSH